MKKDFLLRSLFCVFILCFFLYLQIAQSNELTRLRLEIPSIMKELKTIQQENIKLQFEIDQFENPLHLMELSRNPQFCHLKHPLLEEIVILPDSSSMNEPPSIIEK